MEHKPGVIDTHALHKRRPLSPHISIYNLQLTSGLSILHRITGAYLYFGLLAFSWAIFCLVYFPFILEDISFFINSNFMVSLLFKIMLISWTFALLYHQLNGIRHLFWDVGKGFDLSTVYLSGKIVLGLALFLTISCWVIA